MPCILFSLSLVGLLVLALLAGIVVGTAGIPELPHSLYGTTVHSTRLRIFFALGRCLHHIVCLPDYQEIL